MSANPLQEDPFGHKPKEVHHVTMKQDGRVVIPASIRAQVNMAKGGAFVIRVEDGVVKLEPFSQALAAVQAMMKPYAIEGVLMSDSLIADRRAEAAKEDAEIGQ